MKKLLTRLVNLTIDDSMDEDLVEKIRFLLGISLLGIPFSTVYAVIFFSTGYPISGLLAALGIPLFLAPHMFITTMGFKPARMFSSIMVPVYFCIVSVALGKDAGYYLGYVVIIVPPLLFYGEERQGYIYVAWNLICLGLAFLGMGLIDPFEEIPYAMAIFLSNFFIVLSTGIINVIFFKKELLGRRIALKIKNKEITDSIQYARRIQEAMIPSVNRAMEYMPTGFGLYLPKDIVAGDFYWIEGKGDHVLFAACDCTGHGVPGAMMSVLCHTALNRAVREFDLYEPGPVLDKTRELLASTFLHSEEEVKDGMDVALCCWNTRTNELQYAGAHNPLWIIRDGSETVEEYKADKQAISAQENPKPFTTHNVQLNEGDMVYVFSDGFADQFGGPRGKKYKQSQFKTFLASVRHLDGRAQHDALKNEFETWRGDLEQLDDICLVGFRTPALG